jgi:Tol biopolymer transport system component/predicted Ser/Thr protein kinase
MRLNRGTRLGSYEILEPLGAGGMGEVYRARDTRLGRDVAIKVSKEQFSDRFEREARAVAALNHPHICQLYDVGPNYLVMELIDGQPLKGPLPLELAMKYAAQICDAVDAAHRKGIIHRDLKPANILVAKSGIKLLDFGLAKRCLQAAAGDATETIGLTQEHSILGTPQYMAPEQLEGKEADARSDIFAFGAVLYEMLTGKRTFDGVSRASVIAAILERDPPSVADVAPPALDRVLRRCLSKDAEERWQTVRDLQTALALVTEPRTPVRPVRTRLLPWILAAALAIFALIVMWSARRGSPRAGGEVVRFTIYPPQGTVFTGAHNTTVSVPQFALSPDGRAIVFSAGAATASPMLWLRSLKEVTAHALPGTEGAFAPFWSPDSGWVAFFAEGKLKKIPAGGGSVQVLAEGVPDVRGATWGQDDTILFASGLTPIYRVSAAGGPFTSLTKMDASRHEASHRWPQFLPGGLDFFYTVRGGEKPGVFVGSLDGKTKKFLFPTYSTVAYAPPGYLLSLDGDSLLGRRFDPDRLEIAGQPFTVADGVGRTTSGDVAVSVSLAGVLAHAGAFLQRGRLTWFDRSGHPLDSIPTEGDYTDFRLSPDDSRLAASLIDPKTNYPDIWLRDLARGSTSRVTSGPMINASPVWSPDGAKLIFRTNRKGLIEFYQKSAFGGGNEEPVLPLEAQLPAGTQSINLVPTDWSSDGRNIVYSVSEAASGYALWLFPLAANAKPLRLLGLSSNNLHANFSPNGRLVAYSSNDTGRFQVYVQTIPLSDRKWPVSTNGGYEPRWRGDGGEIYYLSEDRKLMAVPVNAGPSFGVPKALFQTRVPEGVEAFRTHYVPTRDGRRFLVNTQTGDPAPNPITVVLNWTAGVKK